MSYSKRYFEQLDAANSIHIERPEVDEVIKILLSEEKPHLILSGECGVGKSVLLHDVARNLNERGYVASTFAIKFYEAEQLIPQVLSALLDKILKDEKIIAKDFYELNELKSTVLSKIWNEFISDNFFNAINKIMPSLKDKKFIFLDDLFDYPDQLTIERLLDWAGRLANSHAQVVIAGRPSIELSSDKVSRRFSMFQLGPFSRNLTELMSREFEENVGGIAVEVDRIHTETGGNPSELKKALAYVNSMSDILRKKSGFPEFGSDPIRKLEKLEVYMQSLSSASSLKSLCLCALLDPISVYDFRTWTNSSESELDEWIAGMVKASIISQSDNILSFDDADLKKQILKKYVAINEIDRSKLKFGDEAAERDQLFGTSFVAPEDITPIINREKTVVLGDRGAGKSAIFRAMKENLGERLPKNLLVVGSQSPNDFLQTLSADQTISSAEKFKAFWLVYVALCCAEELQLTSEKAISIGKGYAKDARNLLRQLNVGDRVKGEKKLHKIVAMLRFILPEKVSFSVGPIKVDQNLPGMQKSKKSINIYNFLEKTDNVLQLLGKDIVVIFDQIDESHKYERNLQEALVQGLMLAESYLSQKKAIRLTVLLRSDLYETYDIQEKNKFVSRTARLKWSSEKLLAQLLDRTYSNSELVGMRELIFSLTKNESARIRMQLRILFPQEIEGKSFQQWLFDSLENANGRFSPRQIILFLNILRDKVSGIAPAGDLPLYSEMNVISALTELSEHSYKEVISDFRVGVNFVRNCRAGRITEFQLKDVENLFDLKEGTPSRQTEQLQGLGFLQLNLSTVEGLRTPVFRVPKIYTRCWS
ncbi:P-loop ATPase, Sll1717 family [Janthinobacterium lividum]